VQPGQAFKKGRKTKMQSSPVSNFFAFTTPARIARTPRCFLVLTFILLFLCSFASVVRGQTTDPRVPSQTADGTEVARQARELTVEDYCRLTISLMQRSVEEWQERVPVAEKTKTDRKKLASALQAVTKKYQDQRTEEYQRFGFDLKTYLHYTTDHKTEIESFLEDNPDVQQSINDLQKQIDNLIQQFESAASPHPDGGQK
jgi:hypothetical protein